jgi:hypothetical protein
MATDGTLLQGEVSNSTENPLLDGAFVETLLAGFLKTLVLEQLTDSRKEAGHSEIAPTPDTLKQVSAPVSPHQKNDSQPTGEAGKLHLKFIRGGRAGNA